MRFFDAHCDTIGKVWEAGADFAAGPDGDAVRDDTRDSRSGGGHQPGDGYQPGGGTLHVSLPGLRAAEVRAQVFASWAWTGKYAGREFEAGMGKVEAVRRLCEQYDSHLFLALTGAEVAAACAAAPDAPAAPGTRTAVIASLEGSDALDGQIDNLGVFYAAGVRLLTLAWHDTPFCGSTYGEGGGLTPRGTELVEACEDLGLLIDVSHASDRAFLDVCRVAHRPFIASHSNCRSLCPSPRNLTDEMIREIGERGGVVGITLAPGFLSADYHRQTQEPNAEFWRSLADGTATPDEAGRKCAEAEALIPRPPLDLVVDHVRHAIDVGGEDSVGLGGDLDGVDVLPAGFEGVHHYPRIAELLAKGGLKPVQVEKVCWGNMARVFEEVVR